MKSNRELFFMGFLSALAGVFAIFGYVIVLYVLGAILAFRFGSIIPTCIAFALYTILYSPGIFTYMPALVMIAVLLIALRIRTYTIFV